MYPRTSVFRSHRCLVKGLRFLLVSVAVGSLILPIPSYGFEVIYDFEAVVVPDANASIDVCQTTCPGDVVPGLPDGANGIRGSSGTNASRVNIRDSLNGINAADSTGTGTTFSGFFDPSVISSVNQFLVLGDNDGAIYGTGTVSPGSGQSYLRLPFFVPAGTNQVAFSLDFAFEGVDESTTADDVVTAKVTSETGSLSPVTLFSYISESSFGARKLAASELPVWSPLADQTNMFWWLEFELIEAGNGTQSAVGLDNIRVSSVPVPTPLVLLGSSLLAISTVRPKTGRRRLINARN